MTEWLNSLRWNSDGLLPAIAQDKDSGEVLMLAWMNREALRLSSETGTRRLLVALAQKLWFKGEESGHVQSVSEIGSIATPMSSCCKLSKSAELPAIPVGGVVFSGLCGMVNGRLMKKLSKIPTRFIDE